MTRKRINLIIIFLLIITLFIQFTPIEVYANAQSDYNKAQEELNKIEKELNSIKNQKKKQEQEKANTEKQIRLVSSQIESLNVEISETETRLKKKQEELDRKKVEITDTDELFKERLRAMYVQRSSGGMLSTALGVTSFSQLLTNADTLQRISIADTNLLNQLQKEKLEIEVLEAEIKLELTSLETAKSTQVSKQDELNALLKKVNNNLAVTNQSEKEAQQAYNDAKAARDKAAAELEKEFATSGGMGSFVGGTWKWPVPTNKYISSYYGYRNIFGYREFHTGIDIPAPSRTPIIASNSGIVTTAAYAATGYGNRVIIDHGGGYKTLYAHCYSLNVKVGDFVKQGDVIAYVGTTGMSTGNHLHFEIRLNNQYTNPYSYVYGNW